MEEIKNFVDNIHNEAYKNAYSAPLIGAESLIMQGGREEESLDGLWNFSGPNGFWRRGRMQKGARYPLTMLSTTGRPYRFPVSLISQNRSISTMRDRRFTAAGFLMEAGEMSGCSSGSERWPVRRGCS